MAIVGYWHVLEAVAETADEKSKLNVTESSVPVTVTGMQIDDVKGDPPSRTITIPIRVASPKIGLGEVLSIGVKRTGMPTFHEDALEHPLKAPKVSAKGRGKGSKGKRGR